MSRVLYHGTSESNVLNILDEGMIHKSMEGCVYCCESPEDCLKFMILRAFGNTSCIVMPINVPDDIRVEETFDHSYAFFQCRCFGIMCDVPVDWIDVDNCIQYDINR